MDPVTATSTVPGLGIQTVFLALYQLFAGGREAAGGGEAFLATLASWWSIYSIIAFVISVLFAIGVVYSIIRISQIDEMEREDIKAAEQERMYKEGQKNSRWIDVVEHVTSDNPNDWKIAIIEADIMLDELLNSLGYQGLSIGDKLKTVPSGSFGSIHEAWEAHKVRNVIAHEGADFVLTQRAAREAVERYRIVFNEFGVI